MKRGWVINRVPGSPWEGREGCVVGEWHPPVTCLTEDGERIPHPPLTVVIYPPEHSETTTADHLLERIPAPTPEKRR